MFQNKSSPDQQPDYLAQLDHHIQQAFEHLTHLNALIDETDDPKTFYRLFNVYSRNAVLLSRLLLNRQALAPADNPFEDLLGHALDELSAELNLEL